MKKFMYSVLATATMLFATTSCSQDQEIVDITKGEGQKVTFKVEIPEANQSRAVDVNGQSVTIGSGQLATKLIYAQYEAGSTGAPVVRGYQGTRNSDGSFTVELTMAKDINYDVLFLAYNPENNIFGIDPEIDSSEEVQESSINLKALELKNTLQANQEAYDAFVGAMTNKNIKDANRSVSLTRPFAQVNAITTAEDLANAETLGIEVSHSQFIINKAPYIYNIKDGAATGEKDQLTYSIAKVMETTTANTTYPYEVFDTDKYYLATAYVLAGANANSPAQNLTAEFKFYRGNDAEKDCVSTLPIPQLPVQRNYRTNVIGDLLTKTEAYTIKVEAGFKADKEVLVKNVTSLQDLQEVIDDAEAGKPVTAIVIGNMDFSRALNVESRAEETNYAIHVPYGKEIILDLNGFTLSQTKEQTKEYSMILNDGNLTITDSSEKGTGKISYKDSGNGGEYISDAIYNRGILIINGGTIENLSSENVAKNGYPHAIDTYSGIRNTSVTINGGTIYCAEYSAIRMFCVSATNTADLLINGGTIKGAIDMQNGTIAAALGTLTINDGTFETTKNQNNIRFANWNSDVNREYGITAAIKGGSFNGGITTEYVPSAANFDNGIITGGTFKFDPSAFVDEEYQAVQENNVWTIEEKDPVVKIGETEYASLQKAINKATENQIITFIADLEQKDGVLITDKNMTINLNGKTFTVTEGASTNNRNFKITGSSVVTIKNGTMVAAGEYSSGAYGTVRTEGTANVTLENVKLYNYRGNGLNVKALTGTTVTINNTEVYSQYGGGIEAAGGTIELNDVTVEQKGMYTAPYNSMAISVNGGGIVTVNSGTYTTECLTAEEANNQGTSHGPWTAGVLNSGGTLIIEGGTFTNDNYGENSLATYARGLLLADTGANIQINGGTFNAVKAIIDVTNNLGDSSKNPSATLAGGTFSADPCVSGLYASELIQLKDGFVVNKDKYNDKWTVAEFKPVAKIGSTEYGSIEEAIEAWTHNTTLTLLSDVTLSDVVTLKSTEHHILDLGTYTMTAASGKNVIEITPNGAGTAAKSCLTINADATNPGSIEAGSKACIYYKKTDGSNDRLMVTINGGIFNGTISSSSNNGGQACPYFVFNGGVFNKAINLQKAMLKVTGGTFHGMFSCTGDSTAYRLISGGTFKGFTFMTADASTKFVIGTAKENYNVGLYVNDEGYLVVGGPVITDFGDKFAAKATNPTKWSSYLQYSSAVANGLYYTNADMAIKKHGETNVEQPKK